jgi:hypothetical protein
MSRLRMHGAIPPFPQYAFMEWYSVKAEGELYVYLYLSIFYKNPQSKYRFRDRRFLPVTCSVVVSWP